MSDKVDMSREAVNAFIERIGKLSEGAALLRALRDDIDRVTTDRNAESEKVTWLEMSLIDVTAERDALLAANESLAKDAERYRWLRDISVPPHNFYVSVPIEFHDERYKPQDVDAYIDAALAASASAKDGDE